VYVHTTPSDRRYVGISCSPVRRWGNGKGYKANYLFDRAIKKYGWENIKHEILYEGLSLEEAKAIEKELIAKWNLTNPKYGMNLSGGGDGLLSDYTRELMSKRNIGNKKSVGRLLSDDTKKKISVSLCKYYSNHDASFAGKHHTEITKEKLRNRRFSEETRMKMRSNHPCVKGEKNPSAKPVLQIDKDGKVIREYGYAKQAATELNIDLSGLIKCCRGKVKTCGGYKWAYANTDDKGNLS
jgi:group I intron endonuclease